MRLERNPGSLSFVNNCQVCGAAAFQSCDLEKHRDNSDFAIGLPPVKDSGKRQEFETGAVRDCESGKGRYDLLPFHALERLAQIYEAGALKYADENWRKGMPCRRFLDSALRHLCKHAQGRRDEDHLAMAMWNIACLMETEFMVGRGMLPEELADMPDWYNTPADVPASASI